MQYDSLPRQQSMKGAHRVRRFRRSNLEHNGRSYLGRRNRPWKHHAPLRRAAW